MLTSFETLNSDRPGKIAVTREVTANGKVHIIGLSTTQEQAVIQARTIKKSHKKYNQLSTHKVSCRWENVHDVLKELSDIYSVKGSYDREVYNFMTNLRTLAEND